MGFPGGAVVKNLPVNVEAAGDTGSIPQSGRSPGGGNGNPFQYSCLENFMDRGAWQATVHGVSKSRTRLTRMLFYLLFTLLLILCFFIMSYNTYTL